MIDQYINKYGKRLYGLCRTLCANVHDADDLYQETWLKVLSEKLELLNEQFARQNEKRRKIWRAVFVAIGIIASIVLLGELIEFIFTQTAISSMDKSIGIIGGADGPTQIMVARAVNPISDWIFALIGVLTAGIGIYATRQK